jgi:hypothetical protein
LPRLTRAQKAHSIFLEKTCAGFAEALGVPLAVYRSFSELDHANAGITEPRQILDWQCQLLCFKKDETPAESKPRLPFEPSPTAEERAKLIQKTRKYGRWFRVLSMPFMMIGGLLFAPFIGFMFLMAFFCRIRFLRKMFLGNSDKVCEQFLKQLGDAEPKRILFQGDTAVNTRHGCSITGIKPAVILPDVMPPNHKGPQMERCIFEIELGKKHVSCIARSPKGNVIHGLETIESRELDASGCRVQFLKRRSNPKKKYPWIHYDCELAAPRALYCFSCVTEKELTVSEFETLEKTILSFKP